VGVVDRWLENRLECEKIRAKALMDAALIIADAVEATFAPPPPPELDPEDEKRVRESEFDRWAKSQTMTPNDLEQILWAKGVKAGDEAGDEKEAAAILTGYDVPQNAW